MGNISQNAVDIATVFEKSSGRDSAAQKVLTELLQNEDRRVKLIAFCALIPFLDTIVDCIEVNKRTGQALARFIENPKNAEVIREAEQTYGLYI